MASVIDSVSWESKGSFVENHSPFENEKLSKKGHEKLQVPCEPGLDADIMDMASKDSKIFNRFKASRYGHSNVNSLYSPLSSPIPHRNAMNNDCIKDSGIDIKFISSEKLSQTNGHRENPMQKSKFFVENGMPENYRRMIGPGQYQTQFQDLDKSGGFQSLRPEKNSFGGSANSLLKLDDQLRSSDNRYFQDKKIASMLQTSPYGQSLEIPKYERSKSVDMSSSSSGSTCSEIPLSHYLEIIQAKDILIQQKEQLIEKQKMTITLQRQQKTEAEERLHKEIMKAKSFDNEDEELEAQVQELNYQNAQLKAQLAETSGAHKAKLEDLERELGEKEALILKMEKLCKESTEIQTKEVEKYKFKVQEYEAKFQSARDEGRKAKEELKSTRQRYESMKKYMEELPTKDDFKKAINKVREQQQEKESFMKRISSLEDRLRQNEDIMETKNNDINKEEIINTELRSEISRLNTALERFKKTEESSTVSVEEFEEVKWELQRANSNCDMLKKTLEKKHRKLVEMQGQMKERLRQEEDTVLALKEELGNKEVAIDELKKTIKEITNQNQSLLAECLKLKENATEIKEVKNEEVQSAQRRLFKELKLCLKELTSFMKLCSSRAEGKEPDLADLLGVGESEVKLEEDSTEEYASSNFCRTKTLEIRSIRNEVDRLRTFVSDQYAEDVGNSICKVQ